MPPFPASHATDDDGIVGPVGLPGVPAGGGDSPPQPRPSAIAPTRQNRLVTERFIDLVNVCAARTSPHIRMASGRGICRRSGSPAAGSPTTTGSPGLVARALAKLVGVPRRVGAGEGDPFVAGELAERRMRRRYG